MLYKNMSTWGGAVFLPQELHLRKLEYLCSTDNWCQIPMHSG